MYDIIIIGAGPAGMSAALYALRANKKVLLLESNAYGGQIINANKIVNYPALPNVSGFDYAKNLYEQVKSFNGDITYESVLRITKDKKVITDKNEYDGKAIIIATGTQKKKLNILKEDNFLGKGLSYCAVCDGNFFKNKNVAVIGSSKHALDDALYLSDIVSHVYIINSNGSFEDKYNVLNEVSKKDNIKVLYNTEVVSLHGNDKLTSIDIKEKDKETNMEIDGLFIEIGLAPKNELFSNVVELDKNGYIVTDEEMHTKTEGIYAVGDARVKLLRQLVTAASDGAIAASVAIKEL